MSLIVWVRTLKIDIFMDVQGIKYSLMDVQGIKYSLIRLDTKNEVRVMKSKYQKLILQF